MLIRFWILASVYCLCSLGQQRVDRVGFIPRTEQNSRRVQERMSAIQRIKYNMRQMGMNNMKANGMKSSNMHTSGMGSSNFGMNDMGTSHSGMTGMGTSDFGMTQSIGTGMGGASGSGVHMGGNGKFHSNTHSNGFSNNGPGNNMNHLDPFGTQNLHPEQIEAMLDLGALGINRNGNIALINVESMSSGGMGMMGSSFGGNNRRGGRRQKMKLPLCQPLIECAERFIPPQCRSWRFDTINNMMCRSCPVNRCEGGAAEFFNTMYEHHPSRLMYSMLTK